MYTSFERYLSSCLVNYKRIHVIFGTSKSPFNGVSWIRSGKNIPSSLANLKVEHWCKTLSSGQMHMKRKEFLNTFMKTTTSSLIKGLIKFNTYSSFWKNISFHCVIINHNLKGCKKFRFLEEKNNIITLWFEIPTKFSCFKQSILFWRFQMEVKLYPRPRVDF